MELPKNITQIGEVGRDCKIYVEDYVISYMKQLNRAAQDKDMAVALYGKRKEENGIAYYFMYGACKLDFLQREVRHLSQAQRQEIEGYRKRYFQELAFVGYGLLNGDMIEGFHVCEQDLCRYISGYAQFYEKNDLMLAYMLDVREEAQPEQVDQEKYEEVKRRQEERKAATERSVRSARVRNQTGESAGGAEHADSMRRTDNVRRVPNMGYMTTSAGLQRMRLTAVGVFALLCLLGIATFRQDGRQSGSNQENVIAAANSSNVQKDTLVMEDKLEQALLNENQSTENVDGLKQSESLQPSGETGQAQVPERQDASAERETQEAERQNEQKPVSQPENSVASISPDASSAQAEPSKAEQDKTQPSQTASSGAVAYVIQPGDTLIAISKRQYGTDIRVADICNVNKISDPDNIKEGQVIMLPR